MEVQSGSGSLRACSATSGEWAVAGERAARHTAVADAESVRQLKQELAQTQTTVANLECALQTNRRIGMAVGIVMGRLAVTEEEAFTRLRIASQRTNRKLRDIAEDVIYTGLPPSEA